MIYDWWMFFVDVWYTSVSSACFRNHLFSFTISLTMMS